ncbi:hypothetical protein JXD20_02090 [Candidatus Peregrinibacteria bacterium]|nr:hypothetical protein [Candidatus Peregrinibacteria bacterium]
MHPAGIIYTEERKKNHQRYLEAVKRSHFLEAKEKKYWELLGYMLTSDQLKEAEHLIIDEDLRRLATQEQLEKIKPSSEKRHG